VWHRRQKDVWIEEGELLERTFPYRSCRELARRLASYLDGVESISPAVLDDEVVALVSSYLSKRRRPRSRSKRA
jgi:predicted DNA-binding transcriptional regulator YafY